MNLCFNSQMHNMPKWSDKSCSICCMIFKVRLTILGRYALKRRNTTLNKSLLVYASMKQSNSSFFPRLITIKKLIRVKETFLQKFRVYQRIQNWFLLWYKFITNLNTHIDSIIATFWNKRITLTHFRAIGHLDFATALKVS